MHGKIVCHVVLVTSSFSEFYSEVEIGCCAYLKTKPKHPQFELGSGVQFCTYAWINPGVILESDY